MEDTKCYVCGRNAEQVQEFMSEAAKPTLANLKAKIAALWEENSVWNRSIQDSLANSSKPLVAVPESMHEVLWRTAQSDPAIIGDGYPFNGVRSALERAGVPIAHSDTVGEVLQKIQKCTSGLLEKPELRRRVHQVEAELSKIEKDVSPQNRAGAFVDVGLQLSDVFSPAKHGMIRVPLCRVCAGMRDQDLRASAQRRMDEQNAMTD